MTNEEKLREIFPKTILIYRKKDDKTTAIMCSDEWLNAEYKEPKTGHWIRVDKDKLRCSKCDVIHFIAQYPQGKIVWCPNCGAKMESEDK